MLRLSISAIAISLIASIGAADGFGFQTPSRNIYCNGFVSGGGGIDCSSINRQGTPPLSRPASCTQAWGHSFSLNGSGAARMNCENAPSPVNYTDIAPYGVTATFGDITCASESTGLTCRNPQGHGFFLSRRQQLVF